VDRILKSISYIFHPLIIPLLGVIFYFSKAPRYITLDMILAKVVAILILTVLLPIMLFLLLKTLKIVDSFRLETTKERIFPLIINVVLISIIINRVLPYTEFIELYYFFIGALISTIVCLALAFSKFKASIHMTAICGLFMFYIALSIHFSININGTIALMAIITGAVASSRLHLKAHDNRELIMGAFIGALPQLLLLQYWL